MAKTRGDEARGGRGGVRSSRSAIYQVVSPTRKRGTGRGRKKSRRESRHFVTSWGDRCHEKEGELGKMAGAILRHGNGPAYCVILFIIILLSRD